MTPCRCGKRCQSLHLLQYRPADPNFSKVFISHAGNHSEGKYLKMREGLRSFDRSPKHCGTTRCMDGDHANAQVSGRCDGARHGVGNFMQFEIEKHLLALPYEPPNDRRACGGEQLDAHFVRRGRGTQLLDKRLCLRFAVKVQCDDDSVVRIHVGEECSRVAYIRIARWTGKRTRFCS